MGSSANARGQRLSACPHVAVSVFNPSDTPTSSTASGQLRSRKAGISMAGAAVGATKKRPQLRKQGSMAGSQKIALDEPTEEWNGKWIKNHLAWLTKDISDKSESETKSSKILSGMQEWLCDRRLIISDVFVFLVPEKSEMATLGRARTGSDLKEKKGSTSSSGDGKRAQQIVPTSAIVDAINFMELEENPSTEEIHELVTFIKGPQREEVDFGLLKEVFVIVYELKFRVAQATNMFLKDTVHMSQAEFSASMFFREMSYILDKNHWTPEQLFSKIDADGNGDLEIDEMERECKTFMKTQPVPTTKALHVQHPFHILDLNRDGRISREEFLFTFRQVKVAREAALDQETQHPIFLSASGLSKPGPKGRRIFGRRAFVECLMKVALVRLNFHGTAHQAEQNSIFKGLWLVLYMHGNFKRKAAAARPLCRGKAPTPLQRLLRDHPNLFSEAAGGVANDAPGDAWGSKVDALLQQCLTDRGQPRAAGHASLDGQLLEVAVKFN